MGAAYGQTSAILRGRAFAPLQSGGAAAQMRVSGATVEVLGEDGAILSACDRQVVRFDAPIGTAPRRVTLPDGTLFETADHQGVENAFGETTGSKIHKIERLHPRMVGFLLVGIAAVWVIWRYGLDILAAAALAITPPQVVDAIDTGTLQTVDLAIAEPTNSSAEQRAKANEVFSTLLDALDDDTRAAHDFQLEFRSMPGLGPNAVALPGGTVILTDEFMRLFPSEDIQAGVLAHEIGHVVEQHGLRQVYRSIGIAVFIALLAGDTVPIVEDIILEGNILLSLSFSRRSENEADSFGVDLAHRAGYDPAGLVMFFDWLQDEMGDSSSWLSTHPSSAERLERLQELIDAQ